MSTATQPDERRAGIFSQGFAATTVGLLMAITACAFDNTAVTAVMPRITRELGDTGAYSLAFSIPFAVSIVAMVAAGIATDVAGARLSMVAGTVILVIGLALAVVAPDMTVFLFSRGIQGFGIGAVIVAIYAVIAQVYPASLRAPVFAAFAGAWVIPSLVGPALAGVLTEAFSWHAVFLFTLVLLVVAAVLLGPAVRRLPVRRGTLSRTSARMLVAALILSAAAGALNYSPQLALGAGMVAFVLSLPVIALAIRPLVPVGTLRGRSGVPRLVLSRVLTDMVLGAEIYIPLLLAQHRRDEHQARRRELDRWHRECRLGHRSDHRQARACWFGRRPDQLQAGCVRRQAGLDRLEPGQACLTPPGPTTPRSGSWSASCPSR